MKITKLLRSTLYLSSIMVTFTLLYSCSKIDDSTEMNITIRPDTVTFSLPIITTLDTGITIATIPLKFDINSMIRTQNQRFSTADISSLKLNSFLVISADPDTSVTFANYQNLRLTIQGKGNSSNLLASLDPADAKVKTLNIPITATNNDLKTLIDGSDITYTIRGRLRRATTKVHTIRIVSTYQVALRL